ncbi:methionine biosynthesis protein MetW [Porticoccaceae bacterium LTM1]|nr:methionine biosynthesis protein MetW [Porticoccaceae bacterium LTM1]
MRFDHDILTQWIAPQSRVLDLGCGDGSLLSHLKTERQIEGYGLEIDHDAITACIENGVNVVETDLNKGLKNFSDGSFDTVVMTQALQVMRYPHMVLEEMLRVGNECIVTFPNFANWRARFYLMFHGKMPVTKQLSWQWYDTPNIHFCTITDFENLCRDMDIRIMDRVIVAERNPDRQLKGLWPNLFGDTAIYHLSK